jgi:hypothetical protein
VLFRLHRANRSSRLQHILDFSVRRCPRIAADLGQIRSPFARRGSSSRGKRKPCLGGTLGGIVSSVWNLKLVFVDTEDVDSDRANVIIEKLRTQRPVQGEEPEWKVAFEDVSQERAFEELEQSLTTIDGDWGEVLMVYAA